MADIALNPLNPANPLTLAQAALIADYLGWGEPGDGPVTAEMMHAVFDAAAIIEQEARRWWEETAVIEQEARRWWEETAVIEQAAAIADAEWQRWHGLQ